jgi:purine-nucleoside phosphorylase
MGRLSEAVFGRKKLPERSLIYAGSYVPQRKEWVKSLFDGWQRIRGYWVRYSFASRDGREYLLIFNVYGAAMIIEIVQLLRDGDAKRAFFVGSLGGKDLPVGTIVLPTRIVDKTGSVSADSPNKQIVEPRKDSLDRLKKVLEDLSQAHVEGAIVSVPCVLHNIGHIMKLVEKETSILGVEMETSSFLHYSQKEGLESYALLYVSDNKKFDIISGARNVQEARRRSLVTITKVAMETLK